MIDLSKRSKWMIGSMLIILLIVTAFIFSLKEEPPIFVEIEAIEKQADEDRGEQQIDQVIFVDIKGAVVHPGVYQLDHDDRIQDAITKAGGSTEKADLNQINLAKKVYDEMVIYIPEQGEKAEEKLLEVLNGKISINQADEEQLTKLEGIGPSIAKAIIDYRTKHGNFHTIEEIMNVPRIGPKTFEKIKDQITVQ